MSIIININHETGDTSQYTSIVDAHGDLTVTEAAALASSVYGLQCRVNDASVFYGVIGCNNNTSGVARLRYYFNPNSVTISADGWLGNFSAINLSWAAVIYIVVSGGIGGGPYVIGLSYYNDTGARISSYHSISNASHWIEVCETRASSNISSDGTVKLWIDNISKVSTSGIDNYDRFDALKQVLFGNASAGGTLSGTYYLDELIIRDDDTEIGPANLGYFNNTLSNYLLTTSGASVFPDKARIRYPEYPIPISRNTTAYKDRRWMRKHKW